MTGGVSRGVSLYGRAAGPIRDESLFSQSAPLSLSDPITLPEPLGSAFRALAARPPLEQFEVQANAANLRGYVLSGALCPVTTLRLKKMLEQRGASLVSLPEALSLGVPLWAVLHYLAAVPSFGYRVLRLLDADCLEVMTACLQGEGAHESVFSVCEYLRTGHFPGGLEVESVRQDLRDFLLKDFTFAEDCAGISAVFRAAYMTLEPDTPGYYSGRQFRALCEMLSGPPGHDRERAAAEGVRAVAVLLSRYHAEAKA